MKRLLNNQSGSALAMTLIAMLVLMILGTALLNLSVADNKFAIKNEDKLQAYYIAQSGAQAVAEYMINPSSNVSLVGKTSATNTQFSNGNLTVNVQADGTNPNLIYVTATGVYNGTTQTAKLKMLQTAVSTNFLFENAMVASTIMDNEGSGATSIVTGDVLATTLGGIFPPPNSATVSGEKNADPMLPSLLDDVKVDMTPYPATAVAINSSTTLNSPTPVANYYIKVSSVNLSGNDILTINGPGVTHLYVTGDITFTGNAGITVDADATLCIYKETPGTISINGSGNIINNTYIFAPKATVDLNNNNADFAFKGAIIASTIQIPNKVNFIHVPLSTAVDLDLSGVGLFYSGYTWID